MAITGPTVRFVAAALASWAAHMALLFHFVAPEELLSSRPLDGADYDIHLGQTLRVLEGLDRWGAFWVYDVELLAGQPEGTIFDADNKGWELWTFALWKLGLSRGQAFNSFVLAAHAFVPVLVAAAAWLFGVGAWTSLLAGFMASAVWFFDSWLHWGWWIGMVAYATASAAFLVPLSLFHRFTAGGHHASGIAFIPALAICHLLHPYSFFMLAVPLGVLYLRARQSLSWRRQTLVAGAVLGTLALNSVWLIPALRHWHYVLDSAYYGSAGIGHVFADFFNLMLDPVATGLVGTRAGFRTAFFAMTIAMVVLWRRAGDRRSVTLGTALGSLLLFGYFGSYLPGGAQVQPYRHLMPATLLACVGAAAFVQRVISTRALAGIPSAARALLLVCGLGAVQHLARDVIYFIPDLLPDVAPLLDGKPSPLSATGYPAMYSYRFPHPFKLAARQREMASWVVSHIPAGDRVLVEDALLGEHLAWRTRVEVLGGFRHRNIAHAYANFFRYFEDQQADRDSLAAYLRTYAVRWIICDAPRDDFDNAPELLKPLGTIEKHTLYRTQIGVSKVLHGGGEVQASTNRIELRGSRPGQRALLSYHFHKQLVCTPDCRIERAPSPFDPVGLIRIPAPHPPDVRIELRY